MAAQHHLSPQQVVADWPQLVERPKFADAVIIATPDALHREPAVAFARKAMTFCSKNRWHLCLKVVNVSWMQRWHITSFLRPPIRCAIHTILSN
jgi:hypothetical protein